MSNILKELRENLELLPISELRNKASKNFGLRIPRDDTKEDIINRIIGVASKQDFAVEAKGDMPQPGWTRIQVHPVPGKPTFPFYVGINGYFCWVPFNIEVDVPNKIVDVLKDAVEHRNVMDEFGNNKWQLEKSYPFNILASVPGPDPRPGAEVARERKIANKRRFAELHGRWPRDKEVHDMQRDAAQATMLRDIIGSASAKEE